MSPEECIASLDDALSADGEDVILRRISGLGNNATNIDVNCRARVDGLTVQEIAAGIKETDQHVIISPTQITAAQWPGGTVVAVAPFDVNPSIPRKDDKVIAQKRMRNVEFVEPKFINGVLVRINMRVSG